MHGPAAELRTGAGPEECDSALQEDTILGGQTFEARGDCRLPAVQPAPKRREEDSAEGFGLQRILPQLKFQRIRPFSANQNHDSGDAAVASDGSQHKGRGQAGDAPAYRQPHWLSAAPGGG